MRSSTSTSSTGDWKTKASEQIDWIAEQTRQDIEEALGWRNTLQGFGEILAWSCWVSCSECSASTAPAPNTCSASATSFFFQSWI